MGDKCLLQELIRGRVEYSTSLVVWRGKIKYAVRTRYVYDSDEYVWPRVGELTERRRTDAPPPTEPELVAVLPILDGFCGACNLNYKLRSEGDVALLEINTRLGADIACDAPAHFLRRFFEVIAELPPDPPLCVSRPSPERTSRPKRPVTVAVAVAGDGKARKVLTVAEHVQAKTAVAVSSKKKKL